MDSFGQRDNNDRADAAAKALDAYTATNTAEYSQELIETRAGDLICDLLHLVRRDGNEEGSNPFLLPTDLLDRARDTFEEEEEEESGGEEGTFEDEEPHEDTPSLEDRGITLGSYES
ncbi:MAG TPA: hypothetical protein VN688_20475 [Gemmataceae bacterium]|nr:hypothetical protein [Gemmataceae bacterium]